MPENLKMDWVLSASQVFFFTVGNREGEKKRLPFDGFTRVWVYPPPRMPVANEGLGRDSRTEKCFIILVVTGILGGG